MFQLWNTKLEIRLAFSGPKEIRKAGAEWAEPWAGFSVLRAFVKTGGHDASSNQEKGGYTLCCLPLFAYNQNPRGLSHHWKLEGEISTQVFQSQELEEKFPVLKHGTCCRKRRRTHCGEFVMFSRSCMSAGSIPIHWEVENRKPQTDQFALKKKIK